MILYKYILKLLDFTIFYIINRYSIVSKIALIWQENKKYKRYFRQNNIKLPFTKEEKLFICSFYTKKKSAYKYFSLVTPETVIYKWKKAIKTYWTHGKVVKSKGRPSISNKIKSLIKNIKSDNYLWGCRRIRDELLKLDIDISRETIRKVIQDYRKSGDIKPNYSWRKFLKTHWDSLFACDFFTIDIFGFKRLYVLFILELKTRTIVHWNMTNNPTIRFLRHQMNHFEELYPNSYLIHDNSGELRYFPYDEYDITGVSITPHSPNMNAFAERFIRSIRTECLDWFIIFREKQLRSIIREYMFYYNNYRPHQGINSIPNGKDPPIYKSGRIKKQSVLFGLHNHYYREAS